MLNPDLCAWVTAEFALALGLMTDADGLLTFVVPPLPDKPASRSDTAPGHAARGPPQLGRQPAVQIRPLRGEVTAHVSAPPPSIVVSDAKHSTKRETVALSMHAPQPPPAPGQQSEADPALVGMASEWVGVRHSSRVGVTPADPRIVPGTSPATRKKY